MRAQCRHQYMKRSLDLRIVSVEIGARLVEKAAEPRPAGKPGNGLIDAGAGRVQAQPSTVDHAFQPRFVSYRNCIDLPCDPGADMLDEGVEIHPGVVRPATCETVVEEDVQENPGVATTGGGNAVQTRPECMVTVREPVYAAMQRDSGCNAGGNRVGDPALDEVRADVSGTYLVVVGRQQRVREVVHVAAPRIAGTVTDCPRRQDMSASPDRVLPATMPSSVVVPGTWARRSREDRPKGARTTTRRRKPPRFGGMS